MSDDPKVRDQVLWTDVEKVRFFLLDPGLSPPPGDFRIRTATGKRACVDEDSLLDLEISREAASRWIRDELRLVSDSLKHRLRPGTSNARRETPRLELLSALSGEEPDALSSDFETLKRGLEKIGREIGGLVTDALSISEADRERARGRLRKLEETVKRAGKAKTGSPDIDPQPAREAREKVLRSFADLAGSLAEAAERSSARLKTAADELRERAQAAKPSDEDKPSEEE